MENREVQAGEVIVAQVPTNTQVIDASRDELSREITILCRDASAIKVSNDAEYDAAAQMGREVHDKISKVKKLFAPIKEAAHKAHKATIEQEKLMLGKLPELEGYIKAQMSAYATAKRAEQARLEAEARRAAELEKARLLEEACALDDKGDTVAAEQALEDARVYEEAAPVTRASVPKAAGVSVKTDFEVIVTNPALVPVELGGVVLRPVDEAAVMRLVKGTNGETKIPGVTVRKVQKTIFRS